MTFRRLRLALLTLVALVAAQTQAADDEPPFEVIDVGPGRIAVPRGWRALEGLTGKLLYRQGDGIGMVPPVDETGAPLQIGMVVDKFESTKESVAEIVNGLVAQAGNDRRLQLVRKETAEVRLADGTKAMLLRTELLKEKTRRSVQLKLVAKDAESNVWIASAHVVGGKESGWPQIGSTLVKWVEAHLTSFTLDGKKFDAEKVIAAYQVP